jgi:hypothetical protein
MPLTSKRSMWDWAEKIAADHQEPFALVLSELAAAADRGEVVVTAPEAPNEDWRGQFLGNIAKAVSVMGEPLPRNEGIWLLTRRFEIEASEMERWLAIQMPIGGTKVSQTSAGGPRKRGRRPGKLQATIARMREEIASGSTTREELTNMLEKELAAKYGVSRDTVRKARNVVLAEE